MSVSSLCVYCGSSNKVSETFKELARQVGHAIAERQCRLIYGGGHVGLMGIVADSVLAKKGRVIGIIPEHIRSQEVQHTGLTELHVVPDMHTRKRMMADRADAFLILPGGLGTLDETFEILTWKKLHLHNKPVIILNHEGYWDPLIMLIDRTIKEHFSNTSDRALFRLVSTVREAFDILDHEARAEVATMTSRM